jgi:hypothetical protein
MAATGMMMMLKSLGIDPKMLEQVATAVSQAANDLKTIKEQNVEIIRLLKNLGHVDSNAIVSNTEMVRRNGNDTGRES